MEKADHIHVVDSPKPPIETTGHVRIDSKDGVSPTDGQRHTHCVAYEEQGESRDSRDLRTKQVSRLTNVSGTLS